MHKIISLFARNYDGNRLVWNEIVPGAEWVLAGEGVATKKFDGTCCMVRDGRLFKRYDAKGGKLPPLTFEPAQEPDPETGHWPGWVPVSDGPEDRWHREAFERQSAAGVFEDGTYELIGPKIQGNREGFSRHVLIPHGHVIIELDVPRTFDGLRDWFEHGGGIEHEGVVWHHQDGRMVKIKGKDFGFARALPR